MSFNTSQQVIDRYLMGNQASTLMSLLTLKEEIRAQNQLLYVFLDITYSPKKFAFFLYL